MPLSQHFLLQDDLDFTFSFSQLRLLFYLDLLVSGYSITSALCWSHSTLSPTWILIASALLPPCCCSLPRLRLHLNSSRRRIDLLFLQHAPSSLEASKMPIILQYWTLRSAYPVYFLRPIYPGRGSLGLFSAYCQTSINSLALSVQNKGLN